MCRSCIYQFEGKFCQQCKICGHPSHDEKRCGVGVVRVIPLQGKLHPMTVGCQCPYEIYDNSENKWEELAKKLNDLGLF